ncbi:MAG: tripartite tricarboxylate transporter substrate binding protein [Betaproteobacteria bacterium]|nr:tripartite tricarboxylate transporter substrate binding protein [Betaproteobacteria bacterium]
MSIRRFVLAVLFALGAGASLAQPFSGKPIRIIIPFTAGGTNDILARTLGPKLSEALGQPVIVDNRPGGNTVIASQALLASDKDGHTLLLPGNSHVVVPHLTKTPLPFDSIRDFQPVATLARTGLFLVVTPSLPAADLKEFIALAKAKPGALNSAAPGGSINQLATEMFNSLAGVKLVHIPYKGSAPAVADVMAGQAQLSFQTPATVLGNVKGGKLRALAISGETAFADPNVRTVPTFAQAGLPGFDVELWFGLLAPGGTPRAIVDRLNAEVNKIIQSSDFKERVAAQGLEVFVSTPEQYGAALRVESEKFGRIIKAANIEPQ